MSRRPTEARLAAYAILEEVEAGAYADRVADRHLEGLPPRDRGLAQELAFGCVRLRGRLDHELARLVDHPIQRLETPVLLWLRLGLYQLRELRVPAHAAVSESVEGARRAAGRGAGGLVNAVLRRAASTDPEPLFPPVEEDPLGHLTTHGSHPAWLVRRWLDRWGLEATVRLVEHDNRPPPAILRLLDAGECEEAAPRLEGSRVRLRAVPGWPRSCELVAGEPEEALERLHAVFQDPAASAVVDYAGPDLEGPVLDVCAAPGAKALALWWLARGGRPYVAADIAPGRLRRAAEAAAGSGADVLAVAVDGRHPAVARAATVLVDAPCTGTGVLRRRPDARWRAGPGRLASLVTLQRRLLDASAELVPPGGLLVYSTCSLEPEENEEQVVDFLHRHPDFFRTRPEEAGPGLPPDALTDAGDLLVTPWRHAVDGAYAARLRRGPVR